MDSTPVSLTLTRTTPGPSSGATHPEPTPLIHSALRVAESTTSTLPVRSTLVGLRTLGSALTLMSNALKGSVPRTTLTATVKVLPNSPVTLVLAGEGHVAEDELVTHTTPG